MRDVNETSFGPLTAALVTPNTPATHALVLLHGVGGSEHDLVPIAQRMAPGRLIVSFRAPLPMAMHAFAWFQVQFLPTGPVHDWPQAKSSLSRLEEAIADLSAKSGIPRERIAVFGFSQGAIMALGLALQARKANRSNASSAGRTLRLPRVRGRTWRASRGHHGRGGLVALSDEPIAGYEARFETD